jgi:DNA-binding transcriptional regulator YiaG
MSSFATALKSEIARIAKKQIKTETLALKKTLGAARSEISALKKQVKELQGQIKAASRKQRVAARAEPTDAAEDQRQLRFSSARFASQRAKLGISAGTMGRLLGVTGAAVYAWEAGKSRPRRSQLEAIAALRGVGKRELAEKLASLG